MKLTEEQIRQLVTNIANQIRAAKRPIKSVCDVCNCPKCNRERETPDTPPSEMRIKFFEPSGEDVKKLVPMTYETWIDNYEWDGGSDTAWNEFKWNNDFHEIDDFNDESLSNATLIVTTGQDELYIDLRNARYIYESEDSK